MRRVAPLSRDQLASLFRSESLARCSQLYLRNQLDAEVHRREPMPAGSFYGVFGRDGIETVSFFGRSRVCVIGPGEPAAARLLRQVAARDERGFRILIGSRESARALLDSVRPLLQVDLERSQPFLSVRDAAMLGEAGDARHASRSDLAWLASASLRLNEEDLSISARTVDKKLLKRRLSERLDTGSTWIVDVAGRPACKLEVGNTGPAGALIEGVYTEPAHRGRGIARRLVARVARELLASYPTVGLHVGRENTAAVRAYESAGFREVEDLVLALVTWR